MSSKVLRIEEETDEILEGLILIYRVAHRLNINKKGIVDKAFTETADTLKREHQEIIQKCLLIATERETEILKKHFGG